MKKLLLLLSIIALSFTVKAQTQLVTLSPFSQIEKVGDNWELTLPISLNYAIVNPINETYFYGLGIGVGFNFAERATKDVTVPVIGFIGGQVIKSFPAIAVGVGLDANTAQPILCVNLNFYIFKSDSDPSMRKAQPQMKSIIGSTDYKRNDIGFKVQPEN